MASGHTGTCQRTRSRTGYTQGRSVRVSTVRFSSALWGQLLQKSSGSPGYLALLTRTRNPRLGAKSKLLQQTVTPEERGKSSNGRNPSFQAASSL